MYLKFDDFYIEPMMGIKPEYYTRVGFPGERVD